MARLNVRERTIDAKIAFVGPRDFLDLATLTSIEGRGRFREVDGTAEVDWLPTHLGKVGGCDLRVRLCAKGDSAREGADAVVVADDGLFLVAANDVEIASGEIARHPATPEGMLGVLDDAIQVVLRAIREQGRGKASPPKVSPTPSLDEQRAWLLDTLVPSITRSIEAAVDARFAETIGAMARRQEQLVDAVAENGRRSDGLAAALAEIGRRMSTLSTEVSELGARVVLHERIEFERADVAQGEISTLRERVDGLALDVAGVHAAISALHPQFDALAKSGREGLVRALAPLQSELALLRKVETRSGQLQETVAGLTGFVLEMKDSLRPIEASLAAIPDTIRGSSARVERIVQSAANATQSGLAERLGDTTAEVQRGAELARETHELLASAITEAKQKRGGWFR